MKRDDWESTRWKGVYRPSIQEVARLKGTFKIEYTLAKRGAERLCQLLYSEPFIRTGGVEDGMAALMAVIAGWKALYTSGWQVAANANTARETFPDQSLYPADSVPKAVERFNNALLRYTQIKHVDGGPTSGPVNGYYMPTPIVADAEAGMGGNLNAMVLMQWMIKGGAAGVHFEDQDSRVKKCGHLGGKVLVSTPEFIEKLKAARLGAEIMGVPTVLIARTDAYSAKYMLADAADNTLDRNFLTGKKDGRLLVMKDGPEAAIERALAYAPYADLLWCETPKPDLVQAKEFADAIHAKYPGKMLAYNCSPSFHWSKNLSQNEIAAFQEKLAEWGYKFQFITLCEFHVRNFAMWSFAKDYLERGMMAFSELQDREYEAQKEGFPGVKHQTLAGVEYFDEVSKVITGSDALSGMEGSTEKEQF